MKSSIRLLLLLLISALGCNNPATAPTGDSSTMASADQGPWISINEEKISSSGNLFVKDGLGYRISNDRFSELLKLIARQNNTNFTVTPATLLERGATLEVKGKDLAEVMTNLATNLSLKIDKTSETEWVISEANAGGGTSGRITMNDE